MRRKDCKSKIVCRLLAAFQISLDFFFHFFLLFEGFVFWRFHISGNAAWLAIFLLSPYLLPLLCFRVLNLFFPIGEDRFFYGDDCYSPWLGYYKLQNIFYCFPFLERILILLRVYSFWLRLWGAKIGKNVGWTGHVVVGDRANISVGDNCMFGHHVVLFSHLVKPTRKGRLLFFIKNITIEKNCFIGGLSVIGPGVHIQQGSIVPAGSHLHPNKRISRED